MRQLLVEQIGAAYKTVQAELDGLTESPNIADIVEKTIDLFIERSIDIPRIVVLPTGEVTSGFHDFELDLSSVHVQPVAMDILIQHLRTHKRERLASAGAGDIEPQLEDYLVRALIDFDDVSYDDHADLLYKLAEQMLAHLRSYLADEDAVQNVVQFHGRRLADLIHAQMQEHHLERASRYETKVSAGFTTLRSTVFSAPAGEPARFFRDVVEDRQYIRGMRFDGFQRCLYPVQKFDSDTERRFAVILEDDDEVTKWFKPAKDQFKIYYGRDRAYAPDFVVETASGKYLVEPKRSSEMDDSDVQAKKRAAVVWCERASEHELTYGGKPWSYVLIPHDAIKDGWTLQGLVAAHAAETGMEAGDGGTCSRTKEGRNGLLARRGTPFLFELGAGR